MSKLPFPFYVRGPAELAGVTPLGKPPGQAQADLAAGLARIGGLRHPNYFYAYLYAARGLIDSAASTGGYDDLGLPIFYLQRHATELLLKDLLTLAYEVKTQHMKKNPLLRYPGRASAEIRVKRSHNLTSSPP